MAAQRITIKYREPNIEGAKVKVREVAEHHKLVVDTSNLDKNFQTISVEMGSEVEREVIENLSHIAHIEVVVEQVSN
jgi:hypothetical protein